MSSIEYFLRHAIYAEGEHPSQPTWDKYVYDDENIHYGSLKILLENCPGFLDKLLQRPKPAKSVKVILKPPSKPANMDMLAHIDGELIYFEVKIWASLAKSQFDRQVEYIRSQNARGCYILFTEAADNWSNKAILEQSGGCCSSARADDLMKALKATRSYSCPELAEIAEAYKAVIKDIQRRW